MYILAVAGLLASLAANFANPPDDARIMMRWWWFGPSVEKPEIERELRTMKLAGIGGVEIQPVYPVALGQISPYLSDDFLAKVRFANDTARALGMRVDITLGSGWPYGGPTTGIGDAAGMLRCDRIEVKEGTDWLPLPAMETGEALISAFLSKNTSFQQLTEVRADRVYLPGGSSGHRVVLFFISSHTGQQVKRASVGAEGFVLDHYSRGAIDGHLRDVADRLMTAFGDHPPYAVFSDSLEVYGSDWTADLMTEFRRRRGYDLLPYLPALVGDIGPKTADIRHDWGKTLTELAEERYLRPIEDWAKAHNTLFRSQTYGIPPVRLSSNSIVDLPEGEGYQWRQFTPTRWATSAGHLYGRTVTSSETWTWLHSPVFRATPIDLKAEADLHFLQGVNQLIGHGWPYSPPDAGEPGWRFYAAAALNDHNPWFIVMPEIAKYLQRVSYMLRQGRPANDVAVYLPTDDAWARFDSHHTSVSEAMGELLGPDLIPQILNAGFDFDFVDDQAISKVGLKSYRVLLIPRLQRMPSGTQQAIDAYGVNGGIVIDGRTLAGANIGQAISSRLQPDFAFSDSAIGFVHRRLPQSDIYFIANTSNKPVHTVGRARMNDVVGQWWDPFTGETSGPTCHPDHVPLDLAPYESRFLVFSGQAAPHDELQAKTAGKPEIIDLSTDWKLTFATGQTFALDRLRSWTQLAGGEFYSGQATYEKTITLSKQISKSRRVLINFGSGSIPEDSPKRLSGYSADFESPVREAALVYVNDTFAGSVWKPPFVMDISKLIHAGANTLRVIAANLAVNQIAGQSWPDYRLLNLRYGMRFEPQDMQNVRVEAAGMLGPVQLIKINSHPGRVY